MFQFFGKVPIFFFFYCSRFDFLVLELNNELESSFTFALNCLNGSSPSCGMFIWGRKDQVRKKSIPFRHPKRKNFGTSNVNWFHFILHFFKMHIALLLGSSAKVSQAHIRVYQVHFSRPCFKVHSHWRVVVVFILYLFVFFRIFPRVPVRKYSGQLQRAGATIGRCIFLRELSERQEKIRKDTKKYDDNPPV